MDAKQHSEQNSKKGNVTRSESSSSNHYVEKMLKDYKEKTGEVVLIAINDRTTIELPAHLTPEERNARIENYKNLHKSKV